jgi:hypothetical protein
MGVEFIFIQTGAKKIISKSMESGCKKKEIGNKRFEYLNQF